MKDGMRKCNAEIFYYSSKWKKPFFATERLLSTNQTVRLFTRKTLLFDSDIHKTYEPSFYLLWISISLSHEARPH